MQNQVLYRYNRMELEQFAMFEENCSSGVAEVKFSNETQFSFDKDSNVFCCRMAITMMQDEKVLVKGVLKSFFDLKEDSLAELHRDGKYVFLPAILVQFASLSYGALRGVFFTKTMGTVLGQYILPPVNFAGLFDKSFEVEE